MQTQAFEFITAPELIDFGNSKKALRVCMCCWPDMNDLILNCPAAETTQVTHGLCSQHAEMMIEEGKQLAARRNAKRAMAA